MPHHPDAQHYDANDASDMSALPRLGNPFPGKFAISNHGSSQGRGGRGTPVPRLGTRGGRKAGMTKQAPQVSVDHDKPDEDYPAKRYSGCKVGFVSA